MSTTTDIVMMSNIDKKNVPKYFLIMYMSIFFIFYCGVAILLIACFCLFGVFLLDYRRRVTRSSIAGFHV